MEAKYPIDPVMTDVTTEWDDKFCDRCKMMSSSIIREILKFTQMPDMISFAGGLPAPELFPIREFEEACAHVLRTDGQRALQYSLTEGFGPLKVGVAERMCKYGVEAGPTTSMLTTGSQQALELIGRVVIGQGDVVVTGKPTDLGALQAWKVYRPRIVGVPVDDEGMKELTSLKNLKHIEITRTRVSEAGYETLQEQLPNAEILYYVDESTE